MMMDSIVQGIWWAKMISNSEIDPLLLPMKVVLIESYANYVFKAIKSNLISFDSMYSGSLPSHNGESVQIRN